MNTNDLVKAVDKTGTTITKEKLLEAIRNSTNKVFNFSKDTSGSFSLVKIKL